MKNCGKTRSSRRYPGYLRVYNLEYRKALLAVLREDGADLIEMLGLEETIRDLEMRITNSGEYSTTGKLTRGILQEINASSPLKANALEFNRGAERYYRTTLRKKYLEEAFDHLQTDVKVANFRNSEVDFDYKNELESVLSNIQPEEFLSSVKDDLLDETLSIDEITKLVNILIVTIAEDMRRAKVQLDESLFDEKNETSVPRAAHW